jgi:hypothetical protein
MPELHFAPGCLPGRKGSFLSIDKWQPRKEYGDLCAELEIWHEGGFILDCPFDRVPTGALWRPDLENDPRAF